MRWKVLDARERDAWHAALAEVGRHDVYSLPAYHAAYEADGRAKALAFVAERGEHRFVHPFMRHPVEAPGARRGACDLETVYGYGGPLASTADPEFLAEAWAAFDAWARGEGAVAEFVRFNPFLGNHGLLPPGEEAALTRQTVVIALPESEEALWGSFGKHARKHLRSARNAGMAFEEVPLAEGLDAFMALYRKTMDANGARAAYYFDRGYYEALGGLGEKLRLFQLRKDDAVVGSGLFMLHGEVMHFHLTGRDPERSLGQGRMMIYAAACWGLARGYRWLYFGGGLTSAADDPLYAFKASLSEERLPFYTASRIHDREAYAALCEAWRRAAGLDELPAYFRPYRLEAPPAAVGAR